MTIRGTANIANFQYYKVEVGPGANPRDNEWTVVGQLHKSPVANGVAGDVQQRCLPARNLHPAPGGRGPDGQLPRSLPGDDHRPALIRDPNPVSQPASPSTAEEPNGGIARAASIIALGNIASRVLGLVREQIIAYLFGASGLVSVFRVASTVPTMIYDLLIGGMLSAALVPVFSQVAEQEGRAALWALFSRVASLVAVVLAVLVLLLEVLAPQVAWLLGGGFDPDLQAALAQMIRILAPAVLFFGLSGVVTGLLYALKRFTYPAFGAAVFNLGIIVAAPLLAGRLDDFSLAVGVLLGSLLQLLIQTPDLRDVRLRFRLDLPHPALRRILKLYLPIALGLVVSNLQIAIDRRLASSTGESSIAWMANATTLIQLPHGLVAVAISLAVLPTLSRLSARDDMAGFRGTLGQGLRLVLVLIVPATLGLLVLGQADHRPAVRARRVHGPRHPLDGVGAALLPAGPGLCRRGLAAELCLLRPPGHPHAGAGRRVERGRLPGRGPDAGRAAGDAGPGPGRFGQALQPRADHAVSHLAADRRAGRPAAGPRRRARRFWPPGRWPG